MCLPRVCHPRHCHAGQNLCRASRPIPSVSADRALGLQPGVSGDQPRRLLAFWLEAAAWFSFSPILGNLREGAIAASDSGIDPLSGLDDARAALILDGAQDANRKLDLTAFHESAQSVIAKVLTLDAYGACHMADPTTASFVARTLVAGNHSAGNCLNDPFMVTSANPMGYSFVWTNTCTRQNAAPGYLMFTTVDIVRGRPATPPARTSRQLAKAMHPVPRTSDLRHACTGLPWETLAQPAG